MSRQTLTDGKMRSLYLLLMLFVMQIITVSKLKSNCAIANEWIVFMGLFAELEGRGFALGPQLRDVQNGTLRRLGNLPVAAPPP